MSKEIERKFLVSNFVNLYNQHPEISQEVICQGYLAIESSGTEVRVRAKGSHYYLTVKCGQGLVRGEAETEISQEQFETLWPMTEGRRIEKVRFTLALSGNLKLEVDRFGGALEGLVMAEIEFPTEAEAANFRPSVWLKSEVTNDKRFKNQNLATMQSVSALGL